MIVLKNVTKTYKTNIGLDDVSIQIDDGEFVFLVGSSGAGKTTFIKLLLKEIEQDEGTIIVEDRIVNKLTKKEVPFHRRNIGMIFQDFRLLPKKTVFENVAFALEITSHTKKEINKMVPMVLNVVGIGDKSEKYPNELSAGEQQRVAIARALVNRPSIIVADEPTGNLDPKIAWEIMKLLDSINEQGTTIIMVTHAKDIVDKMNKRVVVIDKGKIVRDEQGAYSNRTSQKFATSPFVKRKGMTVEERVEVLLKKNEK